MGNDKQMGPRRSRMGLVAVTGGDGDLMAALGAASAKDGGTCLCLHAGEEAVGLGAMAAVGLEGALGHGGLSFPVQGLSDALALRPRRGEIGGRFCR